MDSRSVLIVLTPEEAMQGCQKEVFCDGMYGPVKIALQPGLPDGAKLYLEGIAFAGEYGTVQYGRLELTVTIQRKKKKTAGAVVAAVLAVLLLILGGAFLFRTVVEELRFYHGSPLDPDQVFDSYSERYYLSQMDPQLQQVAALIYDAAMSFDSHCTLPRGVHKDDFEKVVLILKAECPELMQLDLVTDIVYSYETDTNEVYRVTLNYSVTKDVYEEMRQQCRARIDEILAGTHQMTDREIEKHIFDTLAKSITYDMEAIHCENAFGALVGGRAKCDGISLAMKWCLEEADIQALCILGDPKEGEEGHAWNMICLDGKYYNLDLTASVRNEEYKNNFMDELIIYYQYNVADHWQEESFIINSAFTSLVEKPVCTDDSQGYYVLNGPYIRDEEEVDLVYRDLASQSVSTGKPVVFQLETEDDYERIRRRFMQNDFGIISIIKPMKYEYCLLSDRIIAIYFTKQ